MKKNILIVLQFLRCFMLQAQIEIGSPRPNASTVLELKSTTVGCLLPFNYESAKCDYFVRFVLVE